jgi:lipopolysaccharide export LptBFGC system permease protein LptF
MMAVFLSSAGNKLAINNLKVMARNISIKDLNEKQLYNKFPQLLIYVDKKVDDEKFNDLFIVNKSNLSLIFSKEGKIDTNNAGGLNFNLKDGVIINDEKEISHLSFENFSITLDLMKEKDFKSSQVSLLTMKELIDLFEKDPVYKFQFSSNIALPFSTLIMAFLGFSIGLIYKKNSKTFGIFFSFVIIMLYNLFYMLSRSFIFVGINPFLAAWLPNIFFLFLSTILFYNTSK